MPMAINPRVKAENMRIHTRSSHWVAVSINENFSSQALASTSAVRVDSGGGEADAALPREEARAWRRAPATGRRGECAP